MFDRFVKALAAAIVERQEAQAYQRKLDAMSKEECLKCGGSGEVRMREARTPTKNCVWRVTCNDCGGLGFIYEQDSAHNS